MLQLVRRLDHDKRYTTMFHLCKMYFLGQHTFASKKIEFLVNSAQLASMVKFFEFWFSLSWECDAISHTRYIANKTYGYKLSLRSLSWCASPPCLTRETKKVRTCQRSAKTLLNNTFWQSETRRQSDTNQLDNATYNQILLKCRSIPQYQRSLLIARIWLVVLDELDNS